MIKLKSLTEIRNSYDMILEPYVGTVQSFLAFLKSKHNQEGIEKLFFDEKVIDEVRFILDRIKFNLENNKILSDSIKHYIANVEDHYYANYFLQELSRWIDDYKFLCNVVFEIETKFQQFAVIRNEYNDKVASAILARQSEANLEALNVWIRNIDTRLDGRRHFYELEDFVLPYTQDELCAM